ncbi:MAG: DUF2335 domain-containing protein [Chlamydiae bacterium]|nr:DUF2335 domain-containing protein [Chlamydiota bacterium]
MNELETEKKIETKQENSSIQKRQGLPSSSPSITGQLTSLYSGPIPPPDHLMMYEKMVPGIAKRFLEEPHLEAEHRRNLEKKMVEAKIELGKRGQIIACILASACVIGSFAAIFSGHNIWGLGALLLSIGGLISVFIYSKNHKPSRPEKIEKTDPPMQDSKT